MSTYTAAAQLVRLVREFAQVTPDWAERIVYDTLPDERWDKTLTSRRVYGTPNEFLAIMAAAGLDGMEQELTERRLVLPTARQLIILKDRAGFDNNPFNRDPTVDPLTAR